jgi:hypothetical protein
MRRLVLLLALVVGWFSLTKGERKQLAKAGRASLGQAGKSS